MILKFIFFLLSANFSKEDEPFINQQGVHELFAEILFADPNDWVDDEGAGQVNSWFFKCKII